MIFSNALCKMKKITGCERGVAAIELGLLAPVFILFMALLLDLGLAYNAKLKIVSATAAAAQYAFANGSAVTSSTATTFLTNVATVATTAADLGTAPTTSILFNNASGGTNAGNFYCVSGSSPSTATWSSTGTSSSSCGSNVMSGKFVTITLTTTTTPLFYSTSVVGSIITESDTAIVRVQ